jgi:hypothetical protein
MHIWHDTVDAPRTPRRVSPAQPVDVTVGTWPIGPGQAMWVTWDAVSLDGHRTEGTTAAQWQRNTDVNSYWMARRGPFADGDRSMAALAVEHDVHVTFNLTPVLLRQMDDYLLNKCDRQCARTQG